MPHFEYSWGGGQEVKVLEVKCINTKDENGSQPPQQNRVYDTSGLMTAITAELNGRFNILEKTIVASRGRNKDNPSDRAPGNDVEQRLEPNSRGIANTLTSVQKDNMVLEKNYIGGIYTEVSPNFQHGVMNGMSRYLKARTHDAGVVENTKYKVETVTKIRKLTPLECWRLMDFTDEDFHKAEAVNSNSQLYKQAGNSIVRAVLMGIFSQLNIKGVQRPEQTSMDF